MADRALREKMLSEIERLNAEEKKYEFIKNAKFSNTEEYHAFLEENKEYFIKLKAIQKEKRELKWKIKSSEEKQLERQYLIGLKKKYEELVSYEIQNKYIDAIDLLLQLKSDLSIKKESKIKINAALEILDQMVFPETNS